MLSYLKIWSQNKLFRQFFRFIIIGFSNVGVDFLIYFSLTRGFDWWRENYLLANMTSFVFAATWSFCWNKWWTFKNLQRSNIHHQYVKFMIVSIGALCWSMLILWFSVSILNLSDIIGKLSAVVIVTFWNFFLHRWWTFKEKL